MSDLPPPPSSPGGWPQQPQQPQQPGYPGATPPPYGAPPPGQPPGQPPGPPGPGGPWDSTYGYQAGPTREKAGFWIRFAAFLLDGLIVGTFFLPGLLAFQAGPTEEYGCFVDSSGNIDFTDDGIDNAICERPTGGTVAIGVVLYIAGFVGALVYWGKLEGQRGQTVGKKACGIMTVDANTGQPIGVGRAVGRYFARLLSGCVCYLGYLWMLWDPQRQTWHDKMVNSVVVKA